MSAILPDTMLAAVLYGKEDVRLENIPVPKPGPGEILVRVEAALTCGTDLKVFLRGYHERMIQPPAVFGHEFAGEVVQSDNKRFSVGERVFAANSAPCGECYFCGIGKPNLCDDLLFVNGAYADFIVVPARIVDKNTHALPPDLPASNAALTEPLACAIKGIDDVGVEKGNHVLVIGAGPLGLLLARLSVLAGAVVTIVDDRPDRLSVANELETARTIEGLLSPDMVRRLREEHSPHRMGFDVVIEAVGKPETWNHAVELIRPGGRVNLFGGCPRGTELKVDTTRLHYEEIRIVASFHHTPTTVRKALDLIATAKVPAPVLVREGRSLADLPVVLQELRSGSAPPKSAILPRLRAGKRLSSREVVAFLQGC